MTCSTIYTPDGELSKLLTKFEKFTKASKEKIFEVATDYDSHQVLLPHYFPSVRIISVRPDTTLAEKHLILKGKEFVVMAKHLKKEKIKHEIFFVGGDAKGTRIEEEYHKTPEGTKIILTIDFKASIRLKGIIGKGRFEEEFSKIFDEFIKIAEN